jgi:tetratricopeptide (TPR) repeat protein
MEAIEILEHVLPDYNNPFRIYNLLGELYIKIDNNEKAIEYFNRTLEIKPDNKFALEMISKISEKEK